MSAPEPRPATIASWTRGYKRQRFVTHVAIGNRTACGIALSGTRVSVPDAVAEPCSLCAARKAAA